MRNITLIIKITEQCNLKCRYCYINYGDSIQDLMDMEIIRLIFKRIFTDNRLRQINFIIHGGEPLLVPISYFKKILDIQAEYKKFNENVKVTNSLQTNGTLIDSEWAQFFKDYQIDVGISLDFPPEHHNRLRPSKDGKSTFNKVTEGIHQLREAGFESIGAITILTNPNVEYLLEMYNFFKQLNIGFRPNIYFPDKYTADDPLQIEPDKLSKNLIQLFKAWYYDENPVSIDLFEDIIKSMFRGYSEACTFSGGCHHFLSVRPNGDVFVCDRFCLADFKLGNIIESSFNEMYLTHEANQFRVRSNKLIECHKCPWFNICRGGCPTYSYSFYNKIWEKDFYCKTRKRLFSYIYQTLKKEVKYEETEKTGTKAL